VQKLAVYKDKPILREKEASLVLCYPAPTDSLWDIAKKYSTTTAAIMEANSISAETTPAVVIIPRRESTAKKGHRIL
jgi:LysM repeat protein